MLRLSLSSLAALLVFSATGNAQPPLTPRLDGQRVAPPLSIGDVTPTPEMWFYVQEQRRQDDPREYVRRIAQQEQAQRQARIASRQWYGYSNARPTAGTTPFMGDWSYHWTSNTYMPYQWSAGGSGPTVVVLQPSGTTNR